MDIVPYFIPALQIVWIDVLLSGDNAVVIALACRNLPEEQRRIGVLAGASAAVGLRIVFTLLATTLLGLPWLRFSGGVLLLWIAVKLLIDDDGHDENVRPASSLWKAIQTIVIADVVMSLDNILAIAAVAKDSIALVIFGLLISVPLVVAGSQIILALLQKAQWIVWAGAALLGWVAGDLMMEDKAVLEMTGLHSWHYAVSLPFGTLQIGAASIAGAALVLMIGYLIKRSRTSAASA